MTSEACLNALFLLAAVKIKVIFYGRKCQEEKSFDIDGLFWEI